MIAKLVLGADEIELSDNGIWKSRNTGLALYCNMAFDPQMIPPSPAAGTNEFAEQAREAQRVLGGRLEWAPQPKSNLGTVY